MASKTEDEKPDTYLYERSPLLAAQEGDFGPLCGHLRALAVKLDGPDAALLRYAAGLIEKTIKLPAHCPPSVLHDLRDTEIATYVDKLIGSGMKVGDAIDAAAKAFGCTPSIVSNARAKARHASK